jgi:hypothetical protein
MTVKERVQRATSERIVVMRVGLITEDGIVRYRFSFFLFSRRSSERKERKKKGKGG